MQSQLIRKGSCRSTKDAVHHLCAAARLIHVLANENLSCRQSQQLRLVAEAIAEIGARLRRLPTRRMA
jgi:hypothetical protein